MSDWDYTGYWNVVIGDRWTPESAVVEFDLQDEDRDGLDAWLYASELDAINAGVLSGDEHEQWERLRERAIDDLVEAAAQEGGAL